MKTEAMRELGMDLSSTPTTKLTPELAAQASMLITTGCGDQCPVVPGVIRDDWPLEDLKGSRSRGFVQSATTSVTSCARFSSARVGPSRGDVH